MTATRLTCASPAPHLRLKEWRIAAEVPRQLDEMIESGRTGMTFGLDIPAPREAREAYARLLICHHALAGDLRRLAGERTLLSLVGR